MEENKPVETLDYRGFHVEFFNDDYGQQVYTNWEGQELGFGAYNFGYKEDMKYIIDKKLDFIARISEYPGAELSYFENFAYRDVKLTYRLRTIKVYLMSNGKEDPNSDYLTDEITVMLIADATRVLKEFKELSKKDRQSA